MTANKLKSPPSTLTKFEKELEKLRNENKWARLRDFASTNRDTKLDTLAKFCIAEAELENYLFINPLLFPSNLNAESSSIIQQSHPSLKPSDPIHNTERLLKETITKTDTNSISYEASILLAKLFYSQMRLDEATNLFNQDSLLAVMTDHIKSLKKQQRSGADPLQCVNAASHRQLQLFAEAHSIKGLCLERRRFNSISFNSGYKSSDEFQEEDQYICDSFELASHIAIKHSLLMLQYMSNQEKSNGANSNQTNSNLTSATSNLESVVAANLNSVNNGDDNLDLINPLYEIALQKAPLLYIKRGDLQMGIRMFRDLLLKKNIQSIQTIRQVLLKKFAECLMFNVTCSQYSVHRDQNTTDKYK